MADLNTITCSLKPHSGAFGTYYGQIMSRISQNGVYSSHVINIYTQKKQFHEQYYPAVEAISIAQTGI